MSVLSDTATVWVQCPLCPEKLPVYVTPEGTTRLWEGQIQVAINVEVDRARLDVHGVEKHPSVVNTPA